MSPEGFNVKEGGHLLHSHLDLFKIFRNFSRHKTLYIKLFKLSFKFEGVIFKHIYLNLFDALTLKISN